MSFNLKGEWEDPIDDPEPEIWEESDYQEPEEESEDYSGTNEEER